MVWWEKYAGETGHGTFSTKGTLFHPAIACDSLLDLAGILPRSTAGPVGSSLCNQLSINKILIPSKSSLYCIRHSSLYIPYDVMTLSLAKHNTFASPAWTTFKQLNKHSLTLHIIQSGLLPITHSGVPCNRVIHFSFYIIMYS